VAPANFAHHCISSLRFQGERHGIDRNKELQSILADRWLNAVLPYFFNPFTFINKLPAIGNYSGKMSIIGGMSAYCIS